MAELTKSQSIGYGLLNAGLRCISALPLDVLYAFSDIAYPFVRTFYRKKVVRKNLEEAFPRRSKEELRKIESDFYHHFCDLLAEIVKQPSMSREMMMEHMKFIGIDRMRKVYADGDDLLICYLGHFGNWEWVASLQYWVPEIHCTQVYHPLYDKVFDKTFLNIRTRYGGECIPMKSAVRRLIQLRNEKTKTVCGMISDQLPKWNAIHHFTHFLNHETAVFTGSEQLGKKLGASFMYGRVAKPKRGHYVLEWLPVDIRDDESGEGFEVTDAYMRMLEKDIEAHPELWLWTHKRWRRTKEEWEERNKEKKE